MPKAIDIENITGTLVLGKRKKKLRARMADSLVPATPPIEPSIIFPSCRVIMRPFHDLPHPFSRAVQELKLSNELTSLYFDEWMAVRSHGMPTALPPIRALVSFGWPALLQSHLERFEYDEGWRLLLEVDQYRNGEKLQGWDPADRSTFFCRRVICA
jgi:hypothetical protein